MTDQTTQANALAQRLVATEQRLGRLYTEHAELRDAHTLAAARAQVAERRAAVAEAELARLKTPATDPAPAPAAAADEAETLPPPADHAPAGVVALSGPARGSNTNPARPRPSPPGMRA